MLEIEPKSRDRVYKVKTFGTLQLDMLTHKTLIVLTRSSILSM